MKRSIALALALAASGLTFTPALAQSTSLERSASVEYRDLDLATPEGLETLDRRIDRAARTICEFDAHEVGSRIRSRSARLCYDRAKTSFEHRFAAIIDDERRGG